jgi:hypothetical protein
LFLVGIFLLLVCRLGLGLNSLDFFLCGASFFLAESQAVVKDLGRGNVRFSFQKSADG